MINNLMYIELKTGYSDDGPAWIGYVKTSKSKKTIYFNDHAFQKNIGNYANYIDIENGNKYWISGLKKEESNRHWAGHGKIMIDRRAVNEYLFLIGEKELPLNLFEVVDIEDRFPVKRVKELLNEKKYLHSVFPEQLPQAAPLHSALPPDLPQLPAADRFQPRAEESVPGAVQAVSQQPAAPPVSGRFRHSVPADFVQVLLFHRQAVFCRLQALF